VIDITDVDGLPERVREKLLAIRSVPDEEWRKRQAEARAEEAVRNNERLRRDYRSANGLEGLQRKRTFENFEIRDPMQKPGIDACKSFLKWFWHPRRGLILWGPTGCGKSHLMESTIHAASEEPRPIKARFLSGYSCGRKAQSQKGLVEWALDCDLLGLNDLDKALGGSAAPWATELVMEIVDTALERGGPKLMATTEFPLRSEYGPDGSCIREGYDQSLKPYQISRFEKAFFWQQMDGPNGWEIVSDEDLAWYAR
jgi:hypothetical protein